MTENTKKGHRGAGRVAFLARRAEIQGLLDAGHPLRAIYEARKDQLGTGYPQFTRYVRRYMRKPDDDRHQNRTGQGHPTPQAPAPAATPAAGPEQHHPITGAGPSEQPGRQAKSTEAKSTRPKFIHNATSGNDRDDLI